LQGYAKQAQLWCARYRGKGSLSASEFCLLAYP